MQVFVERPGVPISLRIRQDERRLTDEQFRRALNIFVVEAAFNLGIKIECAGPAFAGLERYRQGAEHAMTGGGVTEGLPPAGLKRRVDDTHLATAIGVDARSVAGAVLRLVDVGDLGMGEDGCLQFVVDEERDPDVISGWHCLDCQFGYLMECVPEGLAADVVARQRLNSSLEEG